MTMPDWVKDYPNYEDMVPSWGFEVVKLDVLGSYQGDITVLLADGERRGFVMIGYGSCSGCDALEAASPGWGDAEGWGPVVALSDELRASVKWFDSADALAVWLTEQVATEGKGSDWYWYDDEVKRTCLRYVERLRGVEEPPGKADPVASDGGH